MEEFFITKIFYYLGIFLFIRIILSILKVIYNHFILKEVDFKKRYGDGWCIITGGSSGIGLSYAKQFIKRGYKVLLISSNIDKLKKAKDILINLYPKAIIEILAYNLSISYTQEIFDDLKSKILETIKNEEISILINNAGYANTKYFAKQNFDEINDCLNINTNSAVFMTKICMENMLKKVNNKSLIVQSGSQLGIMRLQRFSIYSATKCFLEAFNSVLSIENSDKIDFSYIEIGPVDTALNYNDMPYKISADKHAENAMKFMGNYEFSGPVCLYHEFEKFLFFLPFVKKRLIKKGEMVFVKNKLNKKYQ